MAKREPGYCLHKPTGQAYVRFNGRLHYLGKYGSPESRERYARLKSEWLAAAHAEKFIASSRPTLAMVCLAYLDHAEGYYGPGKELDGLKMAIKPVAELYSTLLAESFGSIELLAVRQWWIDRVHKGRRCSRQHANKQTNRVRRIVKWAVAQRMMPAAAYEQARCVEPLKRGRTVAPEGKKVKPVRLDVVEATIPFVPRIIADMIRLQLLTGARSGEICKLTPAMIDRSGDVWTITLDDHKTSHHDKERFLYAGEQAQAILLRYLLRGRDDHLFRPCDTVAQQRAERHAARTTPLAAGNRPGKRSSKSDTRKGAASRTPGKKYSPHSYARAIERACDKAFPAPRGMVGDELKAWRKAHRWTPHQLRHARATEIRRLFGIESASSILGHSNLRTTEIYAEADRERAIAVARQIG